MVDSLRVILPTDDDYEGAKSALVRLQKTYELNVADVINGTILERTTRPMTQQMAVDVAVLALDRKLLDDALLWLTHAQNHLVPPMTPLQDIYHKMSRIHAQVEGRCIDLRSRVGKRNKLKRRITVKTGQIVCKRIYFNPPCCLQSLLTEMTSYYSPKSSDFLSRTVPCARTALDRRAFSIAGSRLLNSSDKKSALPFKHSTPPQTVSMSLAFDWTHPIVTLYMIIII